MGDRGNIIVIDDENEAGELSGVVLYTHWSGSAIERTLKAVLAEEDRWGDAPYLTRMIFCAMVGPDTNSSTGFGIASFIGDNEHDLLVVDVKRQVVVKVERLGHERTTRGVMNRARALKGTAFATFAGIGEELKTIRDTPEQDARTWNEDDRSLLLAGF